MPKSDLDEGQIRELEQFEISQGPLSVLQQAVRNHSQVLISLRNNMFELSARLVGVYKTGHCTKSLTIENADLHVREAPAASPQRSPTRPA